MDVVKLLGEMAADVNMANKEGGTPLFIASQNGRMDTVRFLADKLGADVHKASNKGVTPAQIASSHGHKDIAGFLARRGADLRAASKFGTAADLAASEANDPVLAAYLQAKAHCSNPACADGTGDKACDCDTVRYCSTDCQYTHWPVHQKVCSAVQCSNPDCKDRKVVTEPCDGRSNALYCGDECQDEHC